LIAGYELKVGADGEFLPYANFNNISVSMAGDYEVALRVTDNLGLQALSAAITVHVAENLAPTVFLSCSIPNQLNYPLRVVCNTSAVDSDGTISQQQIDWGDGNLENIWGSAMHVYTSGGTKNIVFTARDNFDATSTITQEINLIAPPTVAFTCYHINSLTIKCDASASSDDSGIASYVWNLNGIEKTGAIITQSFADEQWVNVTLAVTNNLGLQKSTQQSFIVERDPDIPLPVAAFEHTILSDNQVFLDAADSVFGGRVVTQFIWTLGDGTTQNLTTPTLNYTYATPGWYTVTLKTVDQNAVESTPQTIVIRVHAPNVADPGIAGETTLEGIDSNLDGVRDDVERFIDEYFGENSNKRQAMRQAAVTLDQIVKSNADVAVAQPLFVQLDRDSRCVISQLNDETDDWYNALAALKQHTFNTDSRLAVYLALDRDMDIGATKAEDQDISAYADNCNFVPIP
ncbi:MAG: PKD domain-containing protein, partial [Bdellovibrio sp.]|nr:PKD domain-containing protein [Bdellovibrio sp.]